MRAVLGEFIDNKFVEYGPRRLCEEQRTAPPVDPNPGTPNVEIEDHFIFQGNKSYIKGEKLNCKGDIEMLLALQDPVPGSMTADFVSRCARHIPKIKPLYELSSESRQRVNRLRRNLSELSKEQIEQREQMRGILLDHLAALESS